MTNAALKFEDNTDLFHAFRNLCDEFVQITSVENLSIIGYRDPSLIYFAKLPADSQQRVIQELGLLIATTKTLLAQGGLIRDPIALAWIFLKHFKMALPLDFDFSSVLRPGDVIDVYNEYHQLLFASPLFFELCSYSLEEFYCRPWMELFSRSNHAHQDIYKVCDSILRGESQRPVSGLFISRHIMRETEYPESGWFDVQPILYSPVFQNGKTAGYLCVNRVMDGGSPAIRTSCMSSQVSPIHLA